SNAELLSKTRNRINKRAFFIESFIIETKQFKTCYALLHF
ncbi:MAG: hypothetical protein ACI9CZ_001613, partial [Flavobacterium sp.]